MHKTGTLRLLSLILCTVLIAAMALFAAGCGDEKNTSGTGVKEGAGTQVYEDGAVIGEGAVQFTFCVVYKDGTERTLTVNTDKTTVGEALIEHEIIAGEVGEFGLYVKEVNGTTADFDTDGTYWAFYINGEYAISGVDTTDITDGATYSFKVEK